MGHQAKEAMPPSETHLELLRDLQRAVGAVVLHDDHLVRDAAVGMVDRGGMVGGRGSAKAGPLQRYNAAPHTQYVTGRDETTHLATKCLSMSQMTSGRFSRSLYVGSRIDSAGALPDPPPAAAAWERIEGAMCCCCG